MRIQLLMLIGLFQPSAAIAASAPRPICADILATAVVKRLSDLPREIRDDLHLNYKDMGEPGSPLLQTDAPTAAEVHYPTSRFVQGVLIKDVWYVQFEVSMFSGVRTIGYVRIDDGRFLRSPSHYYGGPSCETLKAAINGVYTPGGFNY